MKGNSKIKRIRKTKPSPPNSIWLNELDDCCWVCKKYHTQSGGRACGNCPFAKKRVASQRIKRNRKEKQKIRVMKENYD